MTQKYHVGSNGEATVCTASVQECPLGGEHGSKAEVTKIIAEKLEKEFGNVPESLKSSGIDSGDVKIPEKGYWNTYGNSKPVRIYTNEERDFVKETSSEVYESVKNLALGPSQNKIIDKLYDAANGKPDSYGRKTFFNAEEALKDLKSAKRSVGKSNEVATAKIAAGIKIVEKMKGKP